MITKQAYKVLKEDEKTITYQLNTPIIDEKGNVTWTYNDSNPDIVTMVKHPLFDNPRTGSMPNNFVQQLTKTTMKEKKKSFDPVNRPSHYTDSKYEVIDVLQDKMSPDEFKGFLKGNVLKYIMRADKKGAAKQDLQKAQWYLNKLISTLK